MSERAAGVRAGWGFDQESFTLVTNEESCYLSREALEPISIECFWLFPQAEVAAEEELIGYVTSFEYEPEVTAFPLGDGRVGLHLSHILRVSGTPSAASAASHSAPSTSTLRRRSRPSRDRPPHLAEVPPPRRPPASPRLVDQPGRDPRRSLRAPRRGSSPRRAIGGPRLDHRVRCQS